MWTAPIDLTYNACFFECISPSVQMKYVETSSRVAVACTVANAATFPSLLSLLSSLSDYSATSLVQILPKQIRVEASLELKMQLC
jgi:hypothetical protein